MKRMQSKRYICMLMVCFFIFFVRELIPNKVFAADINESLRVKLDTLLQNEQELEGAIAGVSVRSAAGGHLLYNHFGDIRLRPASNLKLLTAAAALAVLGEKHTFSTEIKTNGVLKRGNLKGNLYLKGKGDPTLLKSDFEKITLQLHKLGITKITGDLVGDDSWFDDTRYPLDLPWSDESTYYGAPISALTASPTSDFDAGTVVIEVKAGKQTASKPSVKVIPETAAVNIVNLAKTVPVDGRKNIKIVRQHDKDTVIVKGTIPAASKMYKEWISVQDPTHYALDLFQQALINQNIQLRGKVKKGRTPENSKLILAHHSMPLTQLLIPFMKLSNNGHAEVLIKEMGRVINGEGSWETGLTVFSNTLAKLGIQPKTMVIRDGSGVSHVDLIQANQITQLLYNVQTETWFPAFLQSLPAAGEKGKMAGGTLRNRLKEPSVQGRVKAKTGSISTVSSLSGYVDTKSGQRLIFSILLNNLLDEDGGKKIEDKIVTILANQ